MEAKLKKERIKKLKICAVLLIILIILVFVKLVLSAKVGSVAEYQEWMKTFGVAGPLFLTVFQAIQVVLPIVPGYLGCAAGAISFGPWIGFICNYIGISAGSIAAYYLARKFGVDLVISLFSEKFYLKWKNRIAGKKSYDVFLFAATVLPLFPDDFLCYFSGLVHMDSKKFIWIIIFGKPWCIIAYSIIFGLIK